MGVSSFCSGRERADFGRAVGNRESDSGSLNQVAEATLGTPFERVRPFPRMGPPRPVARAERDSV